MTRPHFVQLQLKHRCADGNQGTSASNQDPPGCLGGVQPGGPVLKSMSHCKSLLVLPFCKLNAREFGNKGKGKTGKRFVKTV